MAVSGVPSATVFEEGNGLVLTTGIVAGSTYQPSNFIIAISYCSRYASRVLSLLNVFVLLLPVPFRHYRNGTPGNSAPILPLIIWKPPLEVNSLHFIRSRLSFANPHPIGPGS